MNALADLASPIIEAHWWQQPASIVAPRLIGMTFVRAYPDGSQVRGLIVEAEAYEHGDPACHAYRRLTPRNAVMFGDPGRLYVYQIYGLYHCLNIVAHPPGIPGAVLLRALALDRLPPGLPQDRPLQRLAAGPGLLCRALGITRQHNGHPLGRRPGEAFWLEDRDPHWQGELVQTTRIGLTQGTEIPWRWYLRDHPAVSRR